MTWAHGCRGAWSGEEALSQLCAENANRFVRVCHPRGAMKHVLALCGVLAVTACNSAPSCSAVVDHLRQLQAKGGSVVDVSDRAVLVKNCEAESPANEGMRTCVMNAKTLEEAKGCELEAALKK